MFANDHEGVTREAAATLARCYNHLISRDVPQHEAQRFILQTLVALFGQDLDLLPKHLFTQLLDECDPPARSRELLGDLFQWMNTPGGAQGGRYKEVSYFNGGLLVSPSRLKLHGEEVALLRQAASYDWSKVQPEIFGTLFEHSLGKDERHALGAYFTSPVDIMRIVGPTLVEPWRAEIEAATTLREIRGVLGRMTNFHVLDPACGSGNFLYVAYRELKRLEALAVERWQQLHRKADHRKQSALGFVGTWQFHGMDINPFAVELAKVTLGIAHKLVIDELHLSEQALPLDNLNHNIVVADALIDADGARTAWPKADVIIGNPPFLGSKRLKPERGTEYVKALRRLYPEVPGLADYCVYWFRRAHDHLPACTAEEPTRGRAGLVGTQNIRNNQSRVGGLDHIVSGGTITEAVDNHPWSGDAGVHVSIVNWMKSTEASLLRGPRRLWSSQKVSSPHGGTAHELVCREVATINSALSDGIDLSQRSPLACNQDPKRCFQGKIPGYEGFMLSRDEARSLADDSREVLVPYLTGRELLDEFRIERWAIDFGNRDQLEAARHRSAFAWCRERVLPHVRATLAETERVGSDMVGARLEHLERWWQFWNRRDELSAALKMIRRYIACSRVTRRPIMVFLSSRICPSDLVQVFAFDDDYSFGVLQSSLHFEWFKTSSRLKIESDLRYSVRSVFETFPWPQGSAFSGPPRAAVTRVAAAARDLRQARIEALQQVSGGLRGVYRTMDLPGKSRLRDAHEALDAAVLAAYGFDASEALLPQLLQLNQEVAARIERGEQVVSSGIPPTVTASVPLVSDDCFCAEDL